MAEMVGAEQRMDVVMEVNDEEKTIDRILFASYSNVQKRAILLTSGTIGILTPFTDTIYLPALNSVEKDFAASASAVAATISSYLAAVAIGELIFGPLSDKYGRLPVIHGALLSYVAVTLACAFAPTMDALIVLRTIQGFFVSSSVVAAQAMIADVFAPEERGAAMGTFMAPLLIGPVIAPLIGGALADAYGWRSTFLLLAVLTVPILLLTLIFIRHETHHFFYAKRLARLAKHTPERVATGNAPQTCAEAHVEASKLEALAQAMEPPRLITPWHSLILAVDPQLAPYYAIVATSFAGVFVSLTLLPIYLARPPYSLSPAIIGITYLPVGITMFVGSAVGGVLSDYSLRRYGASSLDGRMTLALAGMWAVPLGLVAFGFALGLGAHLAWVLLAQSVLGFGDAMVTPAAMGYLSSARPREAGATGSVMLCLGFGSSAVGISLSVVIADAVGVAVFFVILAAAVAAAAAVATAVNLRRIRLGTGNGHGGAARAAVGEQSGTGRGPAAVDEPSGTGKPPSAELPAEGGAAGGADAPRLTELAPAVRLHLNDPSESPGQSDDRRPAKEVEMARIEPAAAAVLVNTR